MPRDLESETTTINSMASLTKEPEQGAPPASGQDIDETKTSAQESTLDKLHPYVQVLNLNDLESVVNLENATFPPNEACSREKFIYRLTTCGELCLGLFTSATPSAPHSPLRRLSESSFSHLADSTDPSREEVLLAHIVATKSTSKTVTDEDMALPPKWQSDPHADPHLGHKEEGRTICLHSLAVLPEYQNQGLGRTLVLSYLQRIQSAGVADRIALLTYDRLVPFYERLGFEYRGKSKAQYGGGGWNDMVLDIKNGPGSM